MAMLIQGLLLICIFLAIYCTAYSICICIALHLSLCLSVLQTPILLSFLIFAKAPFHNRLGKDFFGAGRGMKMYAEHT